MGIYSILVRPGIMATAASIKLSVTNAVRKTKLKIKTPLEVKRLNKKLSKIKDSRERELLSKSISKVQEDVEREIEEMSSLSKTLKDTLKENLERAASEADVYQKEVAGHILNLGLKEIELIVTYPPMIATVFANPYTISAGPSILTSFKESIDNAKQEAKDLERSFTMLKEKVNLIVSTIRQIPEVDDISSFIDKEFEELDELEKSIKQEASRIESGINSTIDSAKDKVFSTVTNLNVVNDVAGKVAEVSGSNFLNNTSDVISKTTDYVNEKSSAITSELNKVDVDLDLDNLFKPLEELRAMKSEFTGMLSGIPNIKDEVVAAIEKEMAIQEDAVMLATLFFGGLDDVFSKTEKDAAEKQEKQYTKDYKKFRSKSDLDDDEVQRYESAVNWGREHGYSEWGTSRDSECNSKRYV